MTHPAYSDTESDSYSLLDVPRPSVQTLMLQAMDEGRLVKLVVGRQADLSRSIALCLEVLGIGTSGPQRQRSAALSLVGLCTHRKLRPAVDNQLVLRRLCRIIELTDCAAALAAAAEALFKVADDDAWQAKGGVTADLVREALVRCIDSLSSLAAAVNTPDRSDDSPDAAAAAAAAVEEDPGQRAALAAATASVLQGPALHLLSPSQLQQAAGALAAVIAGGLGGSEMLSALSAVVRHGPRAEDRAAAAAAAMQCPNALAALLGAAEVGSHSQSPKQSVQYSDTGGAASSHVCTSAPACPGCAEPGANGSSASPRTFSIAGENAFCCLADVVTACAAGRWQVVEALSSVGIPRPHQVRSLLQLVLFAPSKAAGRALHCLLILTSLAVLNLDGGGVEPAQANGTVAAVVTQVQEQKGASAAVLAAAGRLLRDADAADFSDGGCAAALLRITTGLLSAEVVTVEQLRQQVPGLTDAALGVLAGKEPGSTWRGLFASVANEDGEVVAYPGRLSLAAAELACSLMEWAVKQPMDERGLETFRVSTSKVATALLQRWLTQGPSIKKLFGKLGGYGLGCLLGGLRLSSPTGLWAQFNPRQLSAIAQKLTASVNHYRTSHRLGKVAELASVAAVSMWCRVAPTDATSDMHELIEALLELATAALEGALAAAGPTATTHISAQPHQPLARLAGVLNCVVGCLQPQRAITGAASQPLVPLLTQRLLKPSHTAAAPLWTVATMNKRLPPLLRVMGAAAARITDVAAELMEDDGNEASEQPDETGKERRETAAVPLLRAAVRVAGNAAAIVSAYIPDSSAVKK